MGGALRRHGCASARHLRGRPLLGFARFVVAARGNDVRVVSCQYACNKVSVSSALCGVKSPLDLSTLVQPTLDRKATECTKSPPNDELMGQTNHHHGVRVAGADSWELVLFLSPGGSTGSLVRKIPLRNSNSGFTWWGIGSSSVTSRTTISLRAPESAPDATRRRAHAALKHEARQARETAQRATREGNRDV